MKRLWHTFFVSQLNLVQFFVISTEKLARLLFDCMSRFPQDIGICSSNCVKVQVKPIFCNISSWYWNSEPWKSNKLLRMSDGTLLEHTIIFRTVLVISHEWFLCFGYVTYFSRLFEVGGDDVIYFHPLIRIWLLMLPAVKTFTHSNLVKQHPHSQNKGIFWVRSAYWLKNYKKK